jgi:hypothetical protein
MSYSATASTLTDDALVAFYREQALAHRCFAAAHEQQARADRLTPSAGDPLRAFSADRHIALAARRLEDAQACELRAASVAAGVPA